MPVQLADWTSTDELEQFLYETQPILTVDADIKGKVQLTDQCEDIALSLRNLAMERGKILSIQY